MLPEDYPEFSSEEDDDQLSRNSALQSARKHKVRSRLCHGTCKLSPTSGPQGGCPDHGAGESVQQNAKALSKQRLSARGMLPGCKLRFRIAAHRLSVYPMAVLIIQSHFLLKRACGLCSGCCRDEGPTRTTSSR